MFRFRMYVYAGALCLLVLSCAFLVLAGQDGDGPAEDNGDQKGIQGEWNVTELIRNGQAAPEEIVRAAGYAIGDGTLDPTVDGSKREDSSVAFMLNEETDPKQIDLTEEDSGETSLGIYELRGDRLKICFFRSEETRPETFESKSEGPPGTLIVLQRVKNDDRSE